MQLYGIVYIGRWYFAYLLTQNEKAAGATKVKTKGHCGCRPFRESTALVFSAAVFTTDPPVRKHRLNIKDYTVFQGARTGCVICEK